MRRVHHVSHIAPYDLVRVADLGDARSIPAISGIRSPRSKPLRRIGEAGATPSRPAAIIWSRCRCSAPSAIGDRWHDPFRRPYRHLGPIFRRQPLQPRHPVPPRRRGGRARSGRVVQIGMRGSIYDPSDYDFAKANGIRIIFMEEFARRGPEDVMTEARAIVGDKAIYLSFDIDVIDPSMAPGTGTPEIGGITTREAQAVLRLLRGLAIVGADVVEVAPPFDLAGMTALAGATVMFELLCVIAEKHARSAAA